MALRAVCDYLTPERVLERLLLADAALRDMGIARPKIAVAGLNPHAGENGAFGGKKSMRSFRRSRRRRSAASTRRGRSPPTRSS